MNSFSKLSILVNKILFGTDRPLCYTAYDRKSAWYKLFNLCFFWEKNHCRKAYLSRKIYENRNGNKRTK